MFTGRWVMGKSGDNKAVSTALFDLYERYNRREYVSPDPLQFLYDYGDVRDREVVGLVASSLAYGRVAQILKSVSKVLARMGPSPAGFLRDSQPKALRREFGEAHSADFKHRFTTGEDLSAMLIGAKRAVENHGSLEACFAAGLREGDDTVLPALAHFVGELGLGNHKSNYLLPSPEKGSACKRLNLFLRWMARKDEVDPGGWDGVSPSRLIVPLDTHMHRCCLSMGLTERKQADLKTAVEITGVFKKISPEDPVKFDFSLTRLGIRDELDFRGFLEKCGLHSVRVGSSDPT
ncbi:MAG: TIGR02757 family protein [bacterium]